MRKTIGIKQGRKLQVGDKLFYIFTEAYGIYGKVTSIKNKYPEGLEVHIMIEKTKNKVVTIGQIITWDYDCFYSSWRIIE